VTTASLDALKAYTAGKELGDKGKYQESLPFFKHAVEVDPNFALGFHALAVTHWNGAAPIAAYKPNAIRAFELRERVTEREGFLISSSYYSMVLDDIEKAIEVLELWSKTYPRDAAVRNNLAWLYAVLGQYEKAVTSGNEGIRLNPNLVALYHHLGGAYIALGRFSEAKATYDQARARDLYLPWWHANLYLIAFAEQDQAEMQRQIELAKGKPSEVALVGLQGWTAMFGGRYREASEKLTRATEMDQGRGSQWSATGNIANLAAWGAITGNCPRAKTDTEKALAIAKGITPSQVIGIAPALCGDTSRARSILDDLAREKPTSTDATVLWAPLVRAAIEMTTGDPREAVRILEKSRPVEMGSDAGYWHSYIRGLAYLKQGSATDAMSEFQKILDRPGIWPASVHHPLAHLGIARAAALAGDTTKSRKAYEDFFTLWKDADTDLPILIEAKKEYEKLR
jgi:tetratricopeptide (TPR) repeat protein